MTLATIETKQLVKKYGDTVALDGMPPVTAEFAMAAFLVNAIQLGLLAVAFLGAAALAIDSKPEVSVFFRSRASIQDIIAPRFTMNAAAAVFAFAAGVATAAVVSGILIDWPDPRTTVIASSVVALYLVFVVAVIALFGSVVRRVPATALLTIATMIVLSIIGLFEPIGSWLPSYLVGGFDVVIAGGDFIYWRTVLVTVAVIAGFLWLTVVRLQNREV